MTRAMRAIVYDRFGGPEVLEQRQVAVPALRPHEVLVRVKAAALNPKDSFVRKGRFALSTGRRFPKLLGYDVAGVVEQVGAQVSTLRPGDEVFGMRNGFQGGTIAELVAMPQTELAPRPKTLSFDEAAAIPLAALTALQALRDLGHVKPKDRVLLHGASGGVGVFAVQLARILSAHVTTTSSARNAPFLQSLGAHVGLDYAKDRFLDAAAGWNVVFDIFGNLSFAKVKASLAPKGVYVSTVPSARNIVDDLRTRWSPFKRARLVVVKSNAADLDWLKQQSEAGALKPVVDRVVPLAETAQGQAHIETKRSRGKVVVHVEP